MYVVQIQPDMPPIYQSASQPVCVSGYIFVHTLYPYLQPSAAITQHLAEVLTEAVVRPRLNSNPNTFDTTSFGIPLKINKKHPQKKMIQKKQKTIE